MIPEFQMQITDGIKVRCMGVGVSNCGLDNLPHPQFVIFFDPIQLSIPILFPHDFILLQRSGIFVFWIKNTNETYSKYSGGG